MIEKKCCKKHTQISETFTVLHCVLCMCVYTCMYVWVSICPCVIDVLFCKGICANMCQSLCIKVSDVNTCNCESGYNCLCASVSVYFMSMYVGCLYVGVYVCKNMCCWVVWMLSVSTSKHPCGIPAKQSRVYTDVGTRTHSRNKT